MLQVSGNTQQQVEKLKCFGVAFTSDGKWNEEMNTRIGETNAVLREFIALWSRNGNFQIQQNCRF